MKTNVTVTMNTDGSAAGWASRLMNKGCRVLTRSGPFGRTHISVDLGRASVLLTMDPTHCMANKFTATGAQIKLLRIVQESGAIRSIA